MAAQYTKVLPAIPRVRQNNKPQWFIVRSFTMHFYKRAISTHLNLEKKISVELTPTLWMKWTPNDPINPREIYILQ